MFGIDLIDASLLPAIFIALAAGVISFLSPCVLPIVPPYLAFMAGTSMEEVESGKNRKVIVAAIFFVLGLSTVFMMMGLGASALGKTFAIYKNQLAIGGGVIIMILGLHFLGIMRIPLLYREARIDAKTKGGSPIGAYLLGLAFAFGWTPCIGPILGAILGIVVNEADVTKGLVLMMAYSAGLGLPFILAAVFIQKAIKTMNKFKRHLDRIEKISGLMLWTIGMMMITGSFSDLSFWLLERFPSLGAIG